MGLEALQIHKSIQQASLIGLLTVPPVPQPLERQKILLALHKRNLLPVYRFLLEVRLAITQVQQWNP